MTTHVKLTQAELVEKARELFGDDPMKWAFRCPNCNDVATAGDFPKEKRALIGQHCVGRFLGALDGPAGTKDGRGQAKRGCDWTAYGLIHGPWEIVMPDGHSAWGFPLATAGESARAAAGGA